MTIQDEMIAEIMADDPALVRAFKVRASNEDVKRWRGLAIASTNWGNPEIELDAESLSHHLAARPADGKRDCTLLLGPYPMTPGQEEPAPDLVVDGRFALHARSMVLALCDEIERLRQVAVTQLCNQWEGLFAERAQSTARIQGLLEENARLGTDRTARGDMLEKLIAAVIQNDLWESGSPADGRGLLLQAKEYRDRLADQRAKVPA